MKDAASGTNFSRRHSMRRRALRAEFRLSRQPFFENQLLASRRETNTNQRLPPSWQNTLKSSFVQGGNISTFQGGQMAPHHSNFYTAGQLGLPAYMNDESQMELTRNTSAKATIPACC